MEQQEKTADDVIKQDAPGSGDPRRPWLKSYPPNVPDTITVEPFENLPDRLEKVCARYADRKAFTSFEHSITYERFGRMVKKLAAFLQVALGLRKGQTIAIIMPNLMQYPVSVFAALKCGLRVVNINPLYTAREITGILQSCDASCVIALNTAGKRLEDVSRVMPLKHVIITGTGDS